MPSLMTSRLSAFSAVLPPSIRLMIAVSPRLKS
jgi:hypothetical protein